MGCIYKRGNIYWVKYYRNGKPYQESSRSKVKQIAKALLKKREGEIAQGREPGLIFARVTFDELADDFLRDYRINQKKSINRAERSVNHLKKFFEGMKVPNISTPAINNYIENRLAMGVKNSTINRELSALKRMLNIGANQTPPKVDRVPHIKMLKENNTRKGFFEHREFIALRENLPEYLRGMVTFAYRVGWRLSEITGLGWSQVDLKGGIVRLEAGETKNDEARTVYLDNELSEVFERQWEIRKANNAISPHVFPGPDGKKRMGSFRKTWITSCKKAGLEKKLFHDFRRTAVRNMVRSGVPERVVMMVSGHKSRSVFDRYNIVNDADLQLAAKRQEAYLKSQDSYSLVTIRSFKEKKDIRTNG